jgi:hypothetical protein
MSGRVLDLVLRTGIRQNEEIGYPPVAGLLTESMLVRKSRRGQVIYLYSDSPGAWTLRHFFLLINELANGWLISCPRRFVEKDGTRSNTVTASNNRLRGD